MNATAETTKYLCGEIYVDVLTGPDCDGGREVRGIKDISFAMQLAGKGLAVSLRGFKNAQGKSLEQVLLQQSDALAAIIDIQDALEATGAIG